MTCNHCNDGEGECAYPYYGLAPHSHEGKYWIGSTVMDDKSTWPENFKEDPDCPGMGTFKYCAHCKGNVSEAKEAQDNA